MPMAVEEIRVFGVFEEAIDDEDRASRPQQRGHAVEPVAARQIAGAVDRDGGVEAVFARDFGRVADKRLDLLSTPASAAKRATWSAWDGTQVTAVT